MQRFIEFIKKNGFGLVGFLFSLFACIYYGFFNDSFKIYIILSAIGALLGFIQYKSNEFFYGYLEIFAMGIPAVFLIMKILQGFVYLWNKG